MYGVHSWICILMVILMKRPEVQANPSSVPGSETGPTTLAPDASTNAGNGSNATKDKTRHNPLDCSFNKLLTLIGHSDFSILGMLRNCSIFYIVGDNIKPNMIFNVSEIEGSSQNLCHSPEPLFYRQKNEYKLLVVQKMSMYTGECKWDKSSEIYLKCIFNRNAWKKHSIKPSKSDDVEIIGHTNDLNTDILHIFYTDENGVSHDAMYNVSTDKFINQTALTQKNLKEISYDTDSEFLYMLTNEMIHQKVKSNNGIFSYEPSSVLVNNFSRGSYSAFSFSNHYYLAKKTLGDGRVAYYAGKEGSPEQVCIAETSSDGILSLKLFVSAGNESVHERIRDQLSPKRGSVQPTVETTTAAAKTAARPLLTTTSFILLVLLLFTIFK